jgi:hypothetical protein
LKIGDKVDVMRNDIHSKRFCWVSGTVKKITNLSIHIYVDYEKGTFTVDKKGMFLYPHGEKKEQYEWRFNLK